MLALTPGQRGTKRTAACFQRPVETERVFSKGVFRDIECAPHVGQVVSTCGQETNMLCTLPGRATVPCAAVHLRALRRQLPLVQSEPATKWDVYANRNDVLTRVAACSRLLVRHVNIPAQTQPPSTAMFSTDGQALYPMGRLACNECTLASAMAQPGRRHAGSHYAATQYESRCPKCPCLPDALESLAGDLADAGRNTVHVEMLADHCSTRGVPGRSGVWGHRLRGLASNNCYAHPCSCVSA